MKTESKFRETLKELIKTTPLDEINVLALCEKAKSNRQTFYYHYRDISDVVESIFLKEATVFTKKANDFSTLCKNILSYINSNYAFLYEVNRSFANDKVEQYFYSYFFQRIADILRTTKKLESQAQSQILLVLRYMSNIYSKELCFWIASKRKEKSSSILTRFEVIYDFFTDKYFQELTRKERKTMN